MKWVNIIDERFHVRIVTSKALWGQGVGNIADVGVETNLIGHDNFIAI